MFFVDDFSYEAASWNDRLELRGYNVYRDGRRLTDTPVTEPSFADDVRDSEGHVYHITAVYDKGESAPSDPVTVRLSSVGALYVGAVSVTSLDGMIVVRGASGENVEVYSASGVSFHSGPVSGDAARIPVEPGVYMVKVGAKTFKVVAGR